MEPDRTPPPYVNNSEVTTDDKSTQVAPEPTEPGRGPSSEGANPEIEEPHIVVYVSILKKKSGKSLSDYKSSREAIMLSPSSTYKKTSRLLDKRLPNHKFSLHLPEDARLKSMLYYSIQDGGRDPWLDSNWHNNLRIFDEQSWTAAKALLKKNEKSILMMVVTPIDDAKDLSDEAKKARCVVQ